MTKRERTEKPCDCIPNPFECGADCLCAGCGCIKERGVLFTGPNVIEVRENRKTQTRRIVGGHWKVQAEGKEPEAALHPWRVHRSSCIVSKCDLADDDIETNRRAPPPHGLRCGGQQVLFTGAAERSPYGRAGDRLWVRETWAAGKGYDADPARKLARSKVADMHAGINIWYRADDSGPTYRSKNEGGYYLHTGKPNPGGRGAWRPSIFMPRWASRVTLEVTNVRVERLQSITREDAIAEGVTQFFEWALDPIGKYRELWESINGSGSWKLNPWVWAITFKQVEARHG